MKRAMKIFADCLLYAFYCMIEGTRKLLTFIALTVFCILAAPIALTMWLVDTLDGLTINPPQ